MPSKDRKRQVATTKTKNGADFYKRIGKRGGQNNDKTRFNTETGKANAEKRWSIYREKLKQKEL